MSGENEQHIVPLIQDITVKFRIPKAQTVTYAFPYNYTIEEVKKDVSEKFQILPKFLILKQTNNEHPLDDEQLLLNICDNNYGIVDIDVELSENAQQNNVRLEPQTYYK